MLIRAMFFLMLSGLSASAFAAQVLAPTPTPTLDEFGLFGLGALVGTMGVIALRRRKK